MKFGFDIGGVIDRDPEYFKEIFDSLMAAGHEVHIVTGKPFEMAEQMLAKWGIKYTTFFSIVDYHRQRGTAGVHEETNGWWMPDDVWMSSKGDYAKRVGLHCHMDDEVEYRNWWPEGVLLCMVSADVSPKLCWDWTVNWLYHDRGHDDLKDVKGVDHG